MPRRALADYLVGPLDPQVSLSKARRWCAGSPSAPRGGARSRAPYRANVDDADVSRRREMDEGRDGIDERGIGARQLIELGMEHVEVADGWAEMIGCARQNSHRGLHRKAGGATIGQARRQVITADCSGARRRGTEPPGDVAASSHTTPVGDVLPRKQMAWPDEPSLVRLLHTLEGGRRPGRGTRPDSRTTEPPDPRPSLTNAALRHRQRRARNSANSDVIVGKSSACK